MGNEMKPLNIVRPLACFKLTKKIKIKTAASTKSLENKYYVKYMRVTCVFGEPPHVTILITLNDRFRDRWNLPTEAMKEAWLKKQN